MALYNMPKMGGLFLCNFFVDIWRTICYNQNDLWITYEEGEVGHELKAFNYVCAICTISNFSGYFHFLQIRLDGSNCHIFPPCFIKMKWKIDGSSAHKHERTLQFFTFFPAIYSTYNGSARKKSSRIFSCARADYNIIIFPRKICAYI